MTWFSSVDYLPACPWSTLPVPDLCSEPFSPGNLPRLSVPDYEPLVFPTRERLCLFWPDLPHSSPGKLPASLFPNNESVLPRVVKSVRLCRTGILATNSDSIGLLWYNWDVWREVFNLKLQCLEGCSWTGSKFHSRNERSWKAQPLIWLLNFEQFESRRLYLRLYLRLSSALSCYNPCRHVFITPEIHHYC